MSQLCINYTSINKPRINLTAVFFFYLDLLFTGWVQRQNIDYHGLSFSILSGCKKKYIVLLYLETQKFTISNITISIYWASVKSKLNNMKYCTFLCIIYINFVHPSSKIEKKYFTKVNSLCVIMSTNILILNIIFEIQISQNSNYTRKVHPK